MNPVVAISPKLDRIVSHACQGTQHAMKKLAELMLILGGALRVCHVLLVVLLPLPGVHP
jgi:hypothetical protein